jgi:hypothetical protein
MSQHHRKEIPDNSHILMSKEALYSRAGKPDSTKAEYLERKPSRTAKEEEKQSGKITDQKYSHFFENQKENRVPNQFECRADLKPFQKRRFIQFTLKLWSLILL